MHADALVTPRWDRVSELIAERMGLHFPPSRRADLQRGLHEAAKELHLPGCDAFVDRLLGAPPASEHLATLARHLTIGETYFFRDRPSFHALATHVLPQLIRARTPHRRLRLWSAACSTGEEAYSLAILVQQVLPDWRDWHVSVLATDINSDALEKASAGVYGDWSFRETAPEFRERYFSPAGNRRHRVRAEVRSLVKFEQLNLVSDDFPIVDLILCRNLLMYFAPAPARRLVGNLREALVDDGWLVVSPAECSQAMFQGFESVNHPGCVLYRKWESSTPLHAPTPTPHEILATRELSATSPAVAPEVAPATPPAPAQAVPEAPAPREEPTTTKTSRDIARVRARARTLADQGKLAEALAFSERWVAGDKLDPAAHYFVAMVLQELGERARARAALHRALYLQPEFVLAHVALGHHARAQARHAEARRHFRNAERLLRARPDDDPVEEAEGLTAGRLREIVEALAVDS